MSQETIQERDLIEDWWIIHARAKRLEELERRQLREAMQEPGDIAWYNFAADNARCNPWANGRYAIAALVWGLIFMLVLSVAP